MADHKATQPQTTGGTQRLAEAVQLFEGILLTMPEDRTALEALALAYEQLDNPIRARSCVVRLAKVLIREDDATAVERLTSRLRAYANDDIDALEALRDVERFLEQTSGRKAAGAGAAAPVVTPKPVDDVTLRRQILRREMALAWDLMQAGELTRDEYADVVHDLTDLSSDERIKTISTLSDIFDRDLPSAERVLLHLSARSRCPILPLAAFEPQRAAYGKLPLDFIVRQGVLPFDKLGDDLLVALLNPLDPDLQRTVRERCGANCHFFMTAPASFEKAIEALKAQLAEPA